MLRALDREQLRFVFLHELAHVQRRDIAMNWLMMVLQIAHWFNPVAWFVLSRMRADREQACDALVLNRTGADRRKAYGTTILQLLEGLAPRSVPGAVGILEDRGRLQARIQMIASYPPRRQSSGVAFVLAVVIGAVFLTDAQTQRKADAEAPVLENPEPAPLDLSRYYQEQFFTDGGTNEHFLAIAGRQVIDGLPFDINGRALLYGTKESSWMKRDPTNYPDLIGIPVGRAFDELHLIHNARWADAVGQAVALIRLNYADGSAVDLRINYGWQVRDWSRLASEEKETLLDNRSKIIWRGTGLPSFKSTTRVFKSTLDNPYPHLPVKTLDVLSTGRFASYELLAATVAPLDSNRVATPAVPPEEPERYYSGIVSVLVVDDVSGKPIRGAFVDPGMTVDGVVMIAPPFYTSAAGEGVIRYPEQRTTRVGAAVSAEGYVRQSQRWTNDIPLSFTFRLKLTEKQ